MVEPLPPDLVPAHSHGVSTAIAEQPAPATIAVLSRILDVIDDAVSPAVVGLNRVHTLLSAAEKRTDQSKCGAPSDRWYRLYEQLTNQVLPEGEVQFYPDSHMFTLSAGLLLQEAGDVERRAALLPRQSERASVRDQVDIAAAASRRVAAGLLDQALDALGNRRRSKPAPPPLLGPASRSWRAIAAATDPATGSEQSYVVGSVVYSPTTSTRSDDPAAALGDAGTALRAARTEAGLDDVAGKAATGDRAALERFLALVRTPVVRYCRGRMGEGVGMVTAEDVAQDILLAVCAALPRYRSGETPTMAFVYNIARNKVVDAFRAAGRDRSDPTDVVPDSPADAPDPESTAVLTTETDALRGLLGMLPPMHHEVLVLRIALQFSAEETAATLGSTPGAIRVTQHRALSRLRVLLTESVNADSAPSSEVRDRVASPAVPATQG